MVTTHLDHHCKYFVFCNSLYIAGKLTTMKKKMKTIMQQQPITVFKYNEANYCAFTTLKQEQAEVTKRALI